jgi:hypothetical protein
MSANIGHMLPETKAERELNRQRRRGDRGGEARGIRLLPARPLLGDGRFIPTPDAVIRAILEAAFAKIADETAATTKPPAIVSAPKPKRRR